MDSGPRGLPGARFQGNGARTVERQAAPPLARAAEEQEVAGGAEVASRTSGGRGRGSGVSFLGSLRMAWKQRLLEAQHPENLSYLSVQEKLRTMQPTGII